MVEIDFFYNGMKTMIQCNDDDKMKDIMHKFSTKLDVDLNTIYFLYNGGLLNEELSFNEQASEQDKKKQLMTIVVNEVCETITNEKFKQSEDTICPKCKEPIRISISDYKISLFDCKNHHRLDNIPLNEFEKTQNIDESKIICDICKKVDKSNTHKNEFFICNTCKINICPLCINQHDKEHNLINYNNKNYLCNLHNISYSSFCQNCKLNLCIYCEKQHINHKIDSFGIFIPEIDELKEKMNNFRKQLDEIKNSINEIIDKLNFLKNSLETYYKINNGLIKNYNIRNINYEILQNINNIDKNINFEDINQIINEKALNNKFSKLYDLYNKICSDNKIKDYKIINT